MSAGGLSVGAIQSPMRLLFGEAQSPRHPRSLRHGIVTSSQDPQQGTVDSDVSEVKVCNAVLCSRGNSWLIGPSFKRT